MSVASTGREVLADFRWYSTPTSEQDPVILAARPTRWSVPTATFWRGPIERRTWLEYLSLLTQAVLAPIGLLYVLLTVTLGLTLGITVVGLCASAVMVLAARGFGGLHRAGGRAMLGVDVPPPPPPRLRPGFFGWLWSALSDSAGWRAIAFLTLSFFTSLAGLVISTLTLVLAIGGLTHWYWSRWLPLVESPDGEWHRGAILVNGLPMDTAARQAFLVLVGAFLLFSWPAVTRGFVNLQRMLIVNLLGPTRLVQRLEHLEVARGEAVEDADDKLRRIERDLHDGTQARLVTLAMTLGDVSERISSGCDPQELQGLVDAAHASTKETLVELRSIARGIHPPVIDAGLATALESLTARSPVPVALTTELTRRPSAPVETIAYFCVAELLSNAAQHAGATKVDLRVEERGSRLLMLVTDDGRGGAERRATSEDGRRTGLRGLAERVNSVDGTLDIDSPEGGPTVITVTMPMSVR